MIHLICLALTVQNDSSVIDRHLESVKEIVDSLAICDLGSTDSTLKQIDAFAQKYHLPLYVTHAPWNSSESPRDLALQAAREVCPEDAYILLSDTDLIYSCSGFDKTSLTQDVYTVWTPSPLFSFACYEPTLIRASCREKESPAIPLNTLHAQPCGDAWHKFQRLEKEAVRLSPASSPSDLFALANIHSELLHEEQAMALYKKRMGWEEDRDEVWLSKYRVAEYLDAQGQREEALHWYLEAIQENPMHKEPFFKVARHYCLQGNRDLAYQFFKEGLEVPPGRSFLSLPDDGGNW